MHVLVTGGAGFIGSHVVDTLVRQHIDVSVLDNLTTGSLSHVNPAARFIKMDIRDQEVLPLFERQKYDCVIHFAAQTLVPSSLKDPAFDCDVNIAGMVNILEACRKTAVRRVIFASSAAVYGDVQELPTRETEPKQPQSFYGLSKWVGENYLAMYQRVFGLEYVVLRFANVYGERQGDQGEGGVVSIFARQLQQGNEVTIFGDGRQTRDFIYVGDVAAANCLALQTDHPNAAYNISTNHEISLQELIQYFRTICGRSIDVRYEKARQGDIARSVLDNTQAQKGLNWQPRFKIAEGLARTYHALERS